MLKMLDIEEEREEIEKLNCDISTTIGIAIGVGLLREAVKKELISEDNYVKMKKIFVKEMLKDKKR